MIEISVIYGGAGTGKTEKIVNMVNEIKDSQSFIILAPTHSSVKNLLQRFVKNRIEIDPKKFLTIYSYFRIDYENDDVIGPLKLVQNIFIDEFGLIKKELFEKIINITSKLSLEQKINVNIIISGDIVQLSPIYLEDRVISFRELNENYEDVKSFIVEHDYNSIFSLNYIREAKKILLTENHRSDSNVLKMINGIFYNENIDVIKYINISQVADLIVNQNYTFISSKYEQHQPIYSLVKGMIELKYSNVYFHNDLVFYDGAKFISTQNTKTMKNGDIFEFDHISSGFVYLKSIFDEDTVRLTNEKIIPLFLLTSHKSQGLSIDKVIVCTDDMFDMCMFYTMCTRAVSDLKFYSTKKQDLKIYLHKFHELLEYYGYI